MKKHCTIHDQFKDGCYMCDLADKSMTTCDELQSRSTSKDVVLLDKCAKHVADKIGHGMSEKCVKQAQILLDYLGIDYV